MVLSIVTWHFLSVALVLHESWAMLHTRLHSGLGTLGRLGGLGRSVGLGRLSGLGTVGGGQTGQAARAGH